MKKDIVGFLKRERDTIAEELNQVRQGERQIIHLNGGLNDITSQQIANLEDRLFRFEEWIAASESGVA